MGGLAQDTAVLQAANENNNIFLQFYRRRVRLAQEMVPKLKEILQIVNEN